MRAALLIVWVLCLRAQEPGLPYAFEPFAAGEAHSPVLHPDGKHAWLALGKIFGFTDGPDSVLRSTDGLRTWELIRTPFPELRSLQFPASPDRGWALGGSITERRIVHTTDGGRTWTPQTGGMLLDEVRMNADGLRGWAVGSAGLYRTLDGGGLWSKVEPGLYGNSIAFDAAGVRGVASRGEFGISTTKDGGATWSKSSDIRADRVEMDASGECAIATSSGGGAWLGSTSGTVWRSVPATGGWRVSEFDGDRAWLVDRDGGKAIEVASCRERNLPAVLPSRNVWSVAVRGTRALLGGDFEWVSVSDDRGSTWRSARDPRGGPIRYLEALFVGASGEHVWLAGSQGVMRSGDYGKTWSLSSIKLDGPRLYFLADNRTGWLLDGSGVRTTTDGGEKWERPPQTPQGPFVDIAFDDEGRNGWLAGSQLWTSADGGRSWRQFATPPPHGGASRVSFQAGSDRFWFTGDEGRVYSTRSGEGFREEKVVCSGGIQFTGDGGKGYGLCPNNYLGADVVISDDRGQTWTTVSKQWGWRTEGIWFDDSGRNGWVNTESGFYRSGDGGFHWTHVNRVSRHRLGRMSLFAFSRDLRTGWGIGLDGIFSAALPDTPPRIARFEVTPGDYRTLLEVEDPDTEKSFLTASIEVEGPGMDALREMMARDFSLSELAQVKPWPPSVFHKGETYRFHLRLTDGWNLVSSEFVLGAEPLPTGIVTLDDEDLAGVDLARATFAIGGRQMPARNVLARDDKGRLSLLPQALKDLVAQGYTPAKLIDDLRKLQMNLTVIKEGASLRLSRPFRKSYALLIAIDNYRKPWDRLPKAVEQMQQLEKVLRAQGFEILPPLYNEKATARAIDQALRAAPAGEHDRLLVYFNGHGGDDKGFGDRMIGFIVPYDGESGNLKNTGIRLDDFRNTYSDLKAKQILFVFDSCQSGLLVARDDTLQKEREKLRALSDIEAMSRKPSRVWLTAGRAGQKAYDDGGGIFTRYFIQAIQGKADPANHGVVTFWDLYSWVSSRVREEVSDRWHRLQEPQPDVVGEGGWVFITDRTLLP